MYSRIVCASIYLLLTLGSAHAEERANSTKLNILHIIVDDLRPEITSYGLPDRHTPNIDSLVKNGIAFDRAYAQIAVCGPSRNSLLSGRRPDTSRSWNFINHFREDHPEWTSLPGLFKKAGFNSFGSGKVYHPFVPPNWDGDKSWSALSLPFQNPCWFYGISCVPCVDRKGFKVEPKCNDGGFGPGDVRTCWCEVEAVEDILTVDHALELMDFAAFDFHSPMNKNFYLAVGLHKPHLPWQADKKHFDKFPLENISVAAHKMAPVDMPGIAFASCDSKSPWDPLNDTEARHARRGYYAATAGMDEQVGRLLDALKKRNLLNSTVIALHGDHGWQLGEHGEWRKNTNFELGTRVPLVISGPDMWLPKSRQGQRSAGLSELVDLMPTLGEIAGLDVHSLVNGETPLEGTSLLPLILGEMPEVKNASFSQYPRNPKNMSRPYEQNGIDHTNRTLFKVMGYSIRVDEWRYTEWRYWNPQDLVADWTPTGLMAAELYDHRGLKPYPTDFDISENVNLAEKKDFAEIRVSLASQLKRQYYHTRTDIRSELKTSLQMDTAS
ncbi:hypothetical protein CYMTET_25131 [Cymbomonas tetramitiformis]|uniref:Sulfatase N-terminal domain-containing protein n=1 Tax=Cymbomonas tetramitiformis TaxID=36881 RepID=A0AAE0FUQ5_9CHLO|nr:hypothetical protein CYMTET_25131 [Cymbomonas tetramitiformis]